MRSFSTRPWTAIVAIVSGLIVAAAPVAADNWGANGYANQGDGGPPYCDTSQASECIADGGYHRVYF